MVSSIAQVLSYNMEDFLKSSVELCVELFVAAPSMSPASSVRVASPFTPRPTSTRQLPLHHQEHSTLRRVRATSRVVVTRAG